MTGAASVLVAHQGLLSLVSFGGTPGVLPDMHNFVISRGWMTGEDFANCFAIVQAIPGPNMILLMSFVGWKVGGLPTAIASALVTFGPSCTLAYAAFGWWDRFRDAGWQRRVRRGLAPVVIGLVTAGGFAMALSGGIRLASLALTAAAGVTVLYTRLNPLLLLAIGAALGACGVV